MELRHLKYFLAVADTSNFTRAAAQSFVAQSALSEQIARLEAEVGTALFVRSTRSVRLTDAGELLEPLARRLLADAETAQAELDALTGLRRGRIRLGLIQSAASPIDLIEILGVFHDQYPDIKLEVRNDASEPMAAAVLAGTLDVAIVGLDDDGIPASLEHHLLSCEPLVAVVSRRHPLAGQAKVDLAALCEGVQFIHFQRGSGLRHFVEAALTRAGVPSGSSIEVAQIHDMVRLAARGLGITVVPRSAVTGSPYARTDDAGFQAIPLLDEQAVHPVSVVYNGAHQSSAAKAFLNTFFRNVHGEIPRRDDR